MPEYWVVDPEGDAVEVYRLEGGRYGEPEVLRPGAEVTTAALPGLRLDLADLLRR